MSEAAPTKVFYETRGNQSIDVEALPDGQMRVRWRGHEMVMSPKEFNERFQEQKGFPGPCGIVLPNDIGAIAGALPVSLCAKSLDDLCYCLTRWSQEHPGQRMITPQVQYCPTTISNPTGNEWIAFFWTELIASKGHIDDVAEVSKLMGPEIAKRQTERRKQVEDAYAEAKRLDQENAERQKGELDELRRLAELGKKWEKMHGKGKKK